MAEAKARLGSLFGSNGMVDNTNDPLRYSAPKEPTKAATAAAPSSASSAESTPNIIYTSTVALFKYDAAKRSYASCSPSPVGCVILGNNASYSLLLYNAAKEHLSRSPVTVSLQATLQPGQYVNFYDAIGDNYSARFSTDVDAQTFIRTLFLTKVHVGIWGGGGSAPSISANSLTKEELSSHDASARAISEGDSVGIAFSVWRVVGNAGSSPLDVVTKYAPFEKVSATDVRKFRVGDKAERISALEEGVVGMKKGGHRIVLAPPAKTNGKDWYILQMELVKVKPAAVDSQQASSASRRASEPPKTTSNASDSASNGQGGATTLSQDLVVFEQQKEELEKERQKLLELQKQVQAQKDANGGASQPLPQQQPPHMMYPPQMLYGAPPSYVQPPQPQSYPWAIMGGKPIDALLVELHTKVDHLIRLAPAPSSSVLTFTDAAQTVRGVERLVSENERLVHQIGLQSQQVRTVETKCDDLQASMAKLQAEKAQWKAAETLHQAEVANLVAAKQNAEQKVSRLEHDVQQLQQAFYQTRQTSSETALANETAARSLAEQELNLVKKQSVNLVSLHTSELQSLRVTHEREVAQLEDAHRQHIQALEAAAAQQAQQVPSVDVEALHTQVEQLRASMEHWKAQATAAAVEVEALQSEKALRIERIAELEQMQAFHANARETEVSALQAQVATLQAQIHATGPAPAATGNGAQGECDHCAAADARASQALADAQLKEASARQALEAAEALKKEAQELLLEAPPPSAVAPNVADLFKDMVNEIYYRFQDIFDERDGLEGKQVLKEIKAVLKQSTKEVVAKVDGAPA
ncbi:hypothetical protein DYB32_008064 [Aphanomyces invadans]|uniref:Uncharacterized protein n=1 Tax=Aphanomyces invadans TaxID=157072 RepID=A0A3R6VK49_9STRA|nr:hypothetical protein DYB32_008064 [Aphanomyces invadans]